MEEEENSKFTSELKKEIKLFQLDRTKSMNMNNARSKNMKRINNNAVNTPDFFSDVNSSAVNDYYTATTGGPYGIMVTNDNQ